MEFESGLSYEKFFLAAFSAFCLQLTRADISDIAVGEGDEKASQIIIAAASLAEKAIVMNNDCM